MVWQTQRSRGAVSGTPRAPLPELTPTPKRGERIRWWLRGDPPPLLAQLIAEPDATLAGPSSSARSRVGRKLFYRLSGPAQGALFVKVFRSRAGPARLLTWLRPSRAWREARVADRVAALGFAAAQPIAVGEERCAGVLLRSFAVIEERPARDLRRLLTESELAGALRRQWIASFGALNRRLHDAGIDQDDTSPNNFLLDLQGGDDPWVLIDFERCRVGRPLEQRRRWVLLAKLQRHELGVTRSDRLRFLRAYLGKSDRALRRSAWQAIGAELVRIRIRAARRARHGAFQEGRHVAREGSAWIVRGRERADVIRLPLPRRAARRAWILAHQLERLNLPALRPARLDSLGIALLAPTGGSELDEPARARAIERARRALLPYGRFVRAPQWAICSEGALLRDLPSFRLLLSRALRY